jgi:predicted patatin/cPLA2 family phospholipase
MMENQIKFDGLIGVSAGATFGCNYKSGQIGRALRYNINFKDDPRYMSWRSFLKTGDLVGAEFSYHTLPNELDIFDYETFRQNPMEFHIVCTDAETGEPVYKQLDDMTSEGLDWIRASASMPIVSRPVPLEGRKLLDGGIVNSIPLKHFQELGFERNIVVLTQPKGFFKKRTKLMPLFQLTMRKYPAIIKAMGRRHLMYNEQLQYLAEQERKGNVLLIYPEDVLPIGRTEQNEEKMLRVYQLGRKEAEKHLNKIREFLNQELQQ